MTVLTIPRMTVDQFLAWAEGQPKRYELFRGEVYAMSPKTVGHAKI
jgi:Uma2 family endonuclease